MHNTNQPKTTYYNISFDEIDLFNRPQELQQKDAHLVGLLASDPAQALTELYLLIKEYNDDPVLAQYLVQAYEFTDQVELAHQTIRNNYQRFPLYLFARCAYANLCLEENRIDDAARTIDYTFCLKELYPERSAFYVLEIVVFEAMLVRYFCAIEDYEEALYCLDVIEDIDDNFPILEELEMFITFSILENYIEPERLEKMMNRKKSSLEE